jgi:hypothetical protein
MRKDDRDGEPAAVLWLGQQAIAEGMAEAIQQYFASKGPA